MFEVNTAVLLVVSLVGLVAIGVHIAVALGITSALGIFLVTGTDANAFHTVQAMLADTAYEAIRAYVFAVIPLFMLMGEFIGKSGTVTDVYRGINRLLHRIPGRLAIATVIGNALFSFVTGVSIASAAAFSRIAYPEMKRHGYHKGFALGAIAGSSCLGMLIPPSVLMIVWGILTEQSIGQLFAAGVFPGLMLASMFVLYVFGYSLWRPDVVGIGTGRGQAPATGGAEVADDEEEVTTIQFLISLAEIVLVIVAVLGGIWFGIFTPTEGASAGALIGLALGIIKGMRLRDVIELHFVGGADLRADTLAAGHRGALFPDPRHDRHGERYREPVPRLRHGALDDHLRHGAGVVLARDDHQFHLHHAADRRHLCPNRGQSRL